MVKDADTESMNEENSEAGADAVAERPGMTDEARELAMDLARALFLGMQKVDNPESVDPRSSEFKEKWAAERPKMMKLSRFVLRRLFGQGYQFSSGDKLS